MTSTQVLTKKVGPCGTNGGEVKDMNISGVTRILMVKIYYSMHIEALTITFLRNGCLESTEQWGLPGSGGTSTEFYLQDSEYITSVKGHVDISYIRALKFETNLRSFGPYGREDLGTSFELPAITGQIIGFHGRSGEYLSALGVYVQKLEHTEAKYLMQLDMQKMHDSKIEYLEMENKLQKTDFMHKEATYLKHVQELSSSKDDLQKRLESKDIDDGRVLEDCKQKLQHTETKYLMQLDMQKMHESKIQYLEMENKLQKTDFMHKEITYLNQLQALSSSKVDLQKKLESKCRELDHFDWKAVMPEMIADMIQNAKTTADKHHKNALEKLVEAQNELEMLGASDGLLFFSTITKEATAAIEEKVRKEIKASIVDFQSMKERFKLIKLQEINKNDLEDIRAAIKMVRSIEDLLKWLKSENINEDDDKKIKVAIKPAIEAVQSIENIINNGI